MEYNIFGRTGMKVSDIGFGAWAIGGRRLGRRNLRQGCSGSFNCFMWEKGVNLYDTCDAYGDGHSEELIGEFLRDAERKLLS